jgi:hypothetical protein
MELKFRNPHSKGVVFCVDFFISFVIVFRIVNSITTIRVIVTISVEYLKIYPFSSKLEV